MKSVVVNLENLYMLNGIQVFSFLRSMNVYVLFVRIVDIHIMQNVRIIYNEVWSCKNIIVVVAPDR